MIWLELRTHNEKYFEGWNFAQSIWAPTYKQNGSRWPFWGLVNTVLKNDIIFHLRAIGHEKYFVGISIAENDAYITRDKPTDNKHIWSYSGEFFKVDLIQYQPFSDPIPLSNFLYQNSQALRSYYAENKLKNGSNHLHLFYTIQRNKLGCLFGAYFSELDETLVGLILESINVQIGQGVKDRAQTGEILATIRRRIGHQIFSQNVKTNFNYKCCYPGCKVAERHFLIAGHIARWADDQQRRGHTGNGLCLCAMHDKAFEKGYFTLSKKLEIILVNKEILRIEWIRDLLVHGENQKIKSHNIDILPEAIIQHWRRIGYTPSSDLPIAANGTINFQQQN